MQWRKAWPLKLLELKREMIEAPILSRRIPLYEGGFPKPWTRAHGIQTYGWVVTWQKIKRSIKSHKWLRLKEKANDLDLSREMG